MWVASPMPEEKTDISGRTWDDLIDTDYSILRELAKERDDVRGDGSAEEIVAGLLASEGRPDAVPEEHEHLLEEGEEDEQPEEGQDDEEAEEDEQPEEGQDDEEAEEFKPATEHYPNRDNAWIIDGGAMQTWLDHIASLVEEAKLHIHEDKLHVRMVEPANVGMVDTTLGERAFDSFDVRGEGVIGINVRRLLGIVSNAGADQLVAIDHDSTTHNLVVQIGGHEWSIGLIDPDAIRAEPDLPSLNLPARLTFEEAEYFKDAISFTEDVTDHIKIGSTPEGVFSVYGEGDTDVYEGAFEDEVTYELLPGEEAASLYSVEYLRDIMGTFDRSQSVTLTHGSEYPLLIEGKVSDVNDSEVTYMLAPRIQSS